MKVMMISFIVAIEYCWALLKELSEEEIQLGEDLEVYETQGRRDFRFLASTVSTCQGPSVTSPIYFYAHIGEKEEIPIRNYLSPIETNIKMRIAILPVYGTFDIPPDPIAGNSPTVLTNLYYTARNDYKTDTITYDVTIGNNGRSDSCYMSIRTCFTSCSSCEKEETLSPSSSALNHNCNDCRSGYLHLEDSKNCYKPPYTGDKIYLDPSFPDGGMYRKCPIGCLTCSIKTPPGSVSCDSCDNDNLYYGKEGDTYGCYTEAECPGYILDPSTEPPIWRLCPLNTVCVKCNKYCLTCDEEGTIDDHKCKSCINPYYFYVDPDKKEANCYKAQDGYYLETDNKYHKCHPNCLTCTDQQTTESDNCIECNSNLHFFDEKDPHSCFPFPTEQNYYFNDAENKYYKCFDHCATCSDVGIEIKQNCINCVNPPYSFYENKEPSNCEIDPLGLNEGYWYNPNDNTFYRCYFTCKTCSASGSDTDHKCLSCGTDLSFYEGQGKNCLDNTGNSEGYAYDKTDNTFYFCYITCKTCTVVGTSTMQKCLSCIDDHSFYQYKVDITNCEADQNPIEGYYYVEGDDTYYKCNPLCKSCYFNATVSRIHGCIECIDPYHFIYGTTYCISTDIPDTNYTISEYYLDASDSTFKLCFSTCATCSQGGEGSAHHCDSCKPSYSFIETELVEMNCVPDIGYDGFYLHSNNTFMSCYDSCKTCPAKGDKDNHQCVSCIKGLIPDPSKAINCIKQCPEMWFIDLNGNYQCAKQCPLDYPLLIPNFDQCVDKCPKNLPYAYNGTCVFKCPPNSFPNNFVCSNDCFPDASAPGEFLYIDYTIEQCINEINKTVVHYLPLKRPIDGKDFAFEVILTQPAAQEVANLSLIDFAECELRLRQFYDLPFNEALILVKFDINRTLATYKVEYSSYTIHGEYLDLRHCNKENITVAYPIKKLAKEKKEYGMERIILSIDVFDPKSLFFNSYCIPYHENYSDVTLADKRKHMFLNVSFCEVNCEYSHIDYTTDKAYCNCLTKPGIDINPNASNALLKFPTDLPKTNIVLGKCYHLLFIWRYLKNNYAFWLIGTSTLISVFLIIFYYLRGIKQLYPNMQQYSSKNTNKGNLIHTLYLDLYLTENRIELNNAQAQRDLLENMNLNSKRRCEVLELKANDANFYLNQNLMKLSFSLAKSSDNRTMWQMFFNALIEKNFFINSFFALNDFEVPSLKISHFFLCLNVAMGLHALFFRDALISYNYHEYSFQYHWIFVNSVIICVAFRIIAELTKRLIAIKPLIDLILPERHNRKKFEELLKKIVGLFKTRIAVYFFVGFVLNLASFYYATVFCAVYLKTQIKWVVGVIMSTGLSFVIHVGLCLLMAFLRYHSLVNQKKTMYMISSYLYSVIL